METVPLNPAVVDQPAQPAGRRGDAVRRDHLYWLWGSVIVVVMAFLLVVRPDGRVAFRFATDWALPHTCPSKVLVDFDCPGCGLTRSIICLAHGQLMASIRFHAVGLALAVVIALQIPYRLACLKLGRCPGVPRFVEYWTPRLLIAAMILNFVIRTFFLNHA